MISLSKLSAALVVSITLISFENLYSQANYQVNGRTITKLNNKYYNIVGDDTLKVIENHFLIVPVIGQEKIAMDYLGSHFTNSITYHDALKFIDFRVSSNQDYVQIVNEIGSLGFVSKLITANYLTNIAQGIPNDPSSSNNGWVIEAMELDAAWEITTGNPQTIIAIIDDGRDYDDIDLNQSEAQGWDFIDDDADPDPMINYPSHGTAMSGCIGARTNNNYGTWGIAGGWNSAPVTKMMLRNQGRDPVTNDLLFDVLGFLEAIEYAIDNQAKIINMSYGAPVEAWINAGGEEYMIQLNNAINTAHEAGIVMFASAGDAGYSYVFYPASHEHVISCGASDYYSARLINSLYPICTSNYGTGAEITLPGDHIMANWGDGNVPYPNHLQFSSGSGTSFSTAFASGIASLMIAVNPCLTPDEIKEILYKSCRVWDELTGFIPSPGWTSELGYGIVDAYTAVTLASYSVTENISDNITWNSNRTRGNIIINSGASLTLDDMELDMIDNTGITVMPGGKLYVNNSVITNSCNSTTHRWKGITVYGDNSISTQSPTYQGLAMLTNATIENAEKAIYIKRTSEYGGGMVWALNSDFLNNDVAIDFERYDYASFSHFTGCTFEVNQDFVGTYSDNSIMVNLRAMYGMRFSSCIFRNVYSDAPIGVGIKSYGSDFTLNGVCSSNVLPCPDEYIKRNQFNNLNRGIYAQYNFAGAKTKITYTDFIGNNRGAYFSNCGYFDILNNDFQIPEYTLNGIDKYGLYLEGCTGYHLENNVFESEIANTTGQIGLYIYNSGTTQNYVYRNTFTRLSRAAVADGNNRASGGATGLCFKCNDFSANGTDIDVLATTPSVYTGISLYQGLPSAGNPSTQKDTLAAGNTFTLSTSAYNIRNLSGNVSNYYFHQYTDPLNIKVKPDPVYNIIRSQNDNTTYNKAFICKSWISSGAPAIEDLIAQKEESETGAETAGLQLQVLVDGGSTENLTMDVLGSSPPEALELRDQLLSESPYLSDTVMKTAIMQENVLPNAMVRDVLVENPQAAKNSEIMDMLDQRWNPMPDYMQDEVSAGINVVGGREKLEAVRDGWKQQESYLYNRLVSAYLTDTINPNAPQELKAFLQAEQTPEAGFLLADILMGESNYAAAVQAVTALQGNPALNASQEQQAADYFTLIGILQGLAADNIQPFGLDSLHAIPLFALYESGDNTACVAARDMLVASGLLSYQEPINDSEVTKSIKAESKTFISKGAESVESLRLLPNPACTYTIAEYNILSKQGNAALTIYNIGGNIVWKQNIVKANDQLVIDLTGFKPGAYTVTLSCGNKSISSRKLTVSR
ncbi:MAG TPA: S8 family serine peptidase [Bacteroidales bacterium]|nr:S8 family serine peptidase [Bacteroidales bacterium]HPT01700.1 S8 family serine peptidase [Bacteroidales bacterium]